MKVAALGALVTSDELMEDLRPRLENYGFEDHEIDNVLLVMADLEGDLIDRQRDEGRSCVLLTGDVAEVRAVALLDDVVVVGEAP